MSLDSLVTAPWGDENSQLGHIRDTLQLESLELCLCPSEANMKPGEMTFHALTLQLKDLQET